AWRGRGSGAVECRCLELWTAGKTRRSLDCIGSQSAPADERAEDLQRLEDARLVDEALGELHLIAVADRDGGRPSEKRAQLAFPGLVGRAREQAVLHDVVLDASRTQPPAQLLELADLEAAVLGHHQRDGARTSRRR